MTRARLILTAIVLFALSAAQAQQPAPAEDVVLQPGIQALARRDNITALDFFNKYTRENPTDTRARFLLGGTHLQMGDPKVAAEDFKKALAIDPNYWAAHYNLITADAMAGDWTDFDRARAELKADRDARKPGLSLGGYDTVDIFQIDGKQYHAQYFYQLYGAFHTRYRFVHNGPDGKPVDWIQCESDDADQMFFQQKHPKEAKAGARSFSLDTYRVGANNMIDQALIKFYPDGEPTYEEVRADVLALLSGKTAPAASTTSPGKPEAVRTHP